MSKNNNNSNNSNNNNNNKEEILSTLLNKKRGNGETIDLNTILSLDTRVKKKRLSKQPQKHEHELANDDKESNVPIDNNDQQQTTPVTLAANTFDTSKPIKWDEIQVDELDGKFLNEITFIAKSIGITTSGVRKHEIIEKIKSLVKRNKDTIENKTKQDSINPFNKTSFTELVIPEGQDGINELLFWKIFKNKSIYKRIMSFMNEYPNPLLYDYIISVKSMLDNNQISLLKEKVIRNQYLSFTGFKTIHHYFKHTSRSPRSDVWLQLFQKIQDQDTKFYNHLFKNYQHQIQYLDGDNKFDEITDLLVQSNCIIGLQVLLENFNFKPSKKNLFTAFEYSKPECIKLLRDAMPVAIEVDNDKVEEIGVPGFIPKCIKIKKTIESMKLFIEIFNLSSTRGRNLVKKSLFFNLFIANPLKFRLKELIEIIGMVDTLNLWCEYDDPKNDFQYPKLVSNIYKQEQQKSTREKKEIKSFKFSGVQLKSKLNDPINCNSDEKENIKKLLHVFYRIANVASKTKRRHFVKYYLCYRGTDLIGNDDYYCNPNISDPKCSETYDNKVAKYALQFGDYHTLKNWFNFSKRRTPIDYIHGLLNVYDEDIISKSSFIGGTTTTNNNSGKPSDSNILFKYCQDKELQIQFINSIVQDIKSGNGSNGHGLVGTDQVTQSHSYTLFIFIILVHYNDLNLLKHYVNLIGKQLIIPLTQIEVQRIPNTRNKKNCFLNSLTRYIKSTEVMDYLFEEFYHLICIVHANSFIQTSVSSVIFQNQNLELLKHFQKLHIEYQQKNQQTQQQIQQQQQQQPQQQQPQQQIQQLQLQSLQLQHQLQQLQLQQHQQLHHQQLQPTSTVLHAQQQQHQQHQQLQLQGQIQQLQIQLQQHLQQQLQSQQQQMQQHQHNKITCYGIHTPVLLVQHIFKNISHYNISAIISTKPIDFDDNEENKKIYFNGLRNAILSNQDLKLNPLSFYYSCTVTEYPSKHFIQYFKWLTQFQVDNPTNSLYDPNQKAHIENNKLLLYFIQSDRLIQNETAFQISESGYFKAIVVYSIKRGDLQMLDRILTIFKNHLQELKTSNPIGITERNSIKTFILKYILKVAINEEQLSILEYLLLNHNFIFRKVVDKSSNSNGNNDDDGLFTQQELRELVFASLENYNIEITEFLLSLYTITKSQFEKHANPTSLIHFKNRFK